MSTILTTVFSVVVPSLVAFYLVTPPYDEYRYGTNAHYLEHRFWPSRIRGVVGSYLVYHNGTDLQVSGQACNACGHLSVHRVGKPTGKSENSSIDRTPWMDRDQQLGATPLAERR